MNRNILKALVKLFALVSRADSARAEGRVVVENFLKRQLNAEQVDEYLQEYDQQVDEIHHRRNETQEHKRTSASSVRVLRICTQINEELTHVQKSFLLVRLVEYLSAGGAMESRDQDFVLTVGSTFNLENSELHEAIQFASSTEPVNSANWLIIAKTATAPPGCHRLSHDGISGPLWIFRFAGSGLCFIRSLGQDELYLNGQLMQPGGIYVLSQGAVIRGPKVNPLFYSDMLGHFLRQKEEQKFVFAARNIEYIFPSGKRGLHKFSFSEENGNLIGIMGSSGAGKSTLLNILNGNEKPSTGVVTLNGRDLHDPSTKTEGLIGYVSQDDLLIEELSVFQNLWFNAKLCFARLSEQELLLKVNHVLEDLGLLEIAQLKVGNALNKTISGGQRKRLNIALELIREPAVLFVDEPTSGLSSRDSENIMDLLKELALKGKLVFVVIHQPSSAIFKMFDKLLMLDTGGYPVYFGNPVESVVYFKTLVDHVRANESECPACGNVNPEQLFDMLEARVVDENGLPSNQRKISPREWNIFFKHSQVAPEKSAQASGNSIPESGFRKPGRIAQLKIFFERDLRAKLSNRQYLLINLLEAPLLAMLMGWFLRYSKNGTYIFAENLNVPAYLLVCVIASLFLGLTVSAEEIIRDTRILRREKFLQLSQGSYLVSKVALMFLLSAIQTVGFVLVGHSFMGISDLLIHDMLILFSVSCFANMLGLNISSAFNSAVTIYILIPILIIPQLLLSGVLVRFEHLNTSNHEAGAVPFAANLMAARWGYEAMAVNRFVSNAAEKSVFEAEQRISESNFMVNYWIPKMREVETKASASKALQEIIQIELNRLNTTGAFPKFSFEQWNNSSAEAFTQWLDKLERLATKRERIARNDRDECIRALDGKFNELLQNHHNNQLASLLKKADNFERIRLTENGLYRDFEPIYQIPEPGGFFKGQFYAPVKRFGSTMIPTIWANLIVVWLMSALLFITLYTRALKKALRMGTLLIKWWKKKKR